jgi:branched-chain amino acid transport system substrate-binding protein
MRRALLSLVLFVLIVGIAVGGCAKPAPTPTPTPTPTPVPTKTLDIGINATLTGPNAFLGHHIHNGILLAIDDQNAQGGVTIAGEKYMLNPFIRDNKFDVVVSKTITEEMVYDKGIKIVAGPAIADAVGAQIVTEKNKVILLAAFAAVSGVCGPNKPYSFFPGGYPLLISVGGAAYIQQFYPQAKTVVATVAEIGDWKPFIDSTEVVCQRYGLDFLGYEKVPITTTNFMPLITRVLAKKPDIINTSSVGSSMAAGSPLFIKQIRESGFDGIIWCPSLPPPDVMAEIVPPQYLNKIITNDIVVDSPIVSQAYKDMYQRYLKKFGEPPIDVSGEMYGGMKPFFEFLNGQDTMDTTAWMEGFAKYHWQSIWDIEAFWVGKPLYGIDRVLIWGFWTSEWTDGKPETKWVPPTIPMDLFVGE